MKNTDIQKIRQLLKRMLIPQCSASEGLTLAKQALALLPCETCKDKKPETYSQWLRGLREEDRKLGHGFVPRTGQQKRQLYQMYVDSF